jgi:hypothetical protein
VGRPASQQGRSQPRRRRCGRTRSQLCGTSATPPGEPAAKPPKPPGPPPSGSLQWDCETGTWRRDVAAVLRLSHQRVQQLRPAGA